MAGADAEELETLEAAFAEAQDAAREYVVTNEFGQIVEKAGGTALNASTGYDVTTYFYQLPSNKLELWAYLESERFQNPVMREFYTERDVVIEERRMRTDSSPIGRLIEEFLALAYIGHPYGRPVVGYRSDLDSVHPRQEAVELYDDVLRPEQHRDRPGRRCGSGRSPRDWPRSTSATGSPVRRPPPVRTVEPEQRGQRRIDDARSRPALPAHGLPQAGGRTIRTPRSST